MRNNYGVRESRVRRIWLIMYTKTNTKQTKSLSVFFSFVSVFRFSTKISLVVFFLNLRTNLDLWDTHSNCCCRCYVWWILVYLWFTIFSFMFLFFSLLLFSCVPVIFTSVLFVFHFSSYSIIRPVVSVYSQTLIHRL